MWRQWLDDTPEHLSACLSCDVAQETFDLRRRIKNEAEAKSVSEILSKNYFLIKSSFLQNLKNSELWPCIDYPQAACMLEAEHNQTEDGEAIVTQS